MSLPSAVGFPLMHLEAGERRAFLPCLMPAVQAAGAAAIVVEGGYGEAMGVEAAAYPTHPEQQDMASSDTTLCSR